MTSTGNQTPIARMVPLRFNHYATAAYYFKSWVFTDNLCNPQIKTSAILPAMRMPKLIWKMRCNYLHISFFCNHIAKPTSWLFVLYRTATSAASNSQQVKSHLTHCPFKWIRFQIWYEFAKYILMTDWTQLSLKCSKLCYVNFYCFFSGN